MFLEAGRRVSREHHAQWPTTPTHPIAGSSEPRALNPGPSEAATRYSARQSYRPEGVDVNSVFPDDPPCPSKRRTKDMGDRGWDARRSWGHCWLSRTRSWSESSRDRCNSCLRNWRYNWDPRQSHCTRWMRSRGTPTGPSARRRSHSQYCHRRRTRPRSSPVKR